MAIDIDKILEEMKERQQIRCPYCKEIIPNDDYIYPVSYHGSEEGPEEMECDNCGETFFVEEEVTREYKVAKIKEELDGL